VNESDLRKYIRRELLREYDDQTISASEFDDVVGAFKNIFVVAGTALKDISSTLKLTFDVAVSKDKAALEKAFAAYDNRVVSLGREYAQGLEYANKALKGSSFDKLLFMTNPGAYLGYALANLNSADNYGAIRDWFKEVGVEIDQSTIPPGTSDEDLALMATLTGATSTGRTSVIEQQKKLQASIDRLFGFSGDSPGAGDGSAGGGSPPSAGSGGGSGGRRTVSESAGRLNEGSFNKVFGSVLKKMDSKDFKVPDSAVEGVYTVKKEEAEEYAKMLTAPTRFIEELQKSKTPEEVKKALTVLQGSPFKIAGLDKINPNEIEKSTEKAIEAAKEKDKMDELMKQVGANEKMSEEEVFKLVKAFQLKALIGGAIVNAKKEMIPQIEDARKEFLEKYQKGTDLELISKIAPGSELEKTLKDGIEKIKNAGKRKATP
jgi:hypothetical protein